MVAPRPKTPTLALKRPRQFMLTMRDDPAPAAQPLAGAAEVHIAVHGFSPFEPTALASFFRLGEPHAAGGAAARPTACVLVDHAARRLLALRLERFGYRVQLLSSGEQALALFERQRFAIAFVDIVLDRSQAGGIDGLRVCQAIKRRGQPEAGGTGTGTAVVILTGRSSSTARVRGALAGCDAYLTKPLIAPEFMAALRRVDPLFQWQAGSAAEPAEPAEPPEAAGPGAPMG